MRAQFTDTQIGRIITDFQTADIDETTKAILEFAVKVTKAAPTVTPADLDHLRSYGLTDEALFAIVEIVGFFSYINRIADAFGVELDDFLELRRDFNESNG
ncbi:peroxidase [Candidatus Poribacteria bacterium]|nr:peroxidase [Candidatus Poribacteria bacterium]MYA98979.1 peroxidase [Candidatus Poribacteria bacterium]